MRVATITVRASNGAVEFFLPGVICSVLRCKAGKDQHAKMASRTRGAFKVLQALTKPPYKSTFAVSSRPEINFGTGGA